MSRPNRYPGTCKVCKTDVAENAGYALQEGVAENAGDALLEGGRWIVKCTPCSGVAQVPAAAPTVDMNMLASGEVLIKPRGFLGGGLFRAYAGACEGARYDRGAGGQVASVALAAGNVAKLLAVGFALVIAPAVQAAMEAQGNATKSAILAADARADAVDAKLAARGLALYPFQRAGVRWLSSRDVALLADEMGLGKTIQTIVAIPDGAPVVVVCPAVAKGVWRRETAKWRPEHRVTVLKGRGSFRWPAPGEMVVTNYDILPDGAGAAPSGVVLVADEAHGLKNSKARRTKRFQALSQAARKAAGKVYLLTATPLLNRAPELWAVFEAAGLALEAFGSWSAFVRMFGGMKTDYGTEWGTPDEAEVAPRLRRVSLRRLRATVLPELPGKTANMVPVDLDDATKRLCDATGIEEMIRAAMAEAHDAEKGAEAALAAMNAALKDSLAFERISAARKALAQAKTAAMLEMVDEFEEAGQPVVVFSAHRMPVDLLGRRPGWRCITGDTPPDTRTEIEDAFQRGDLKGVACTIKAGGVAITLTRAHQAIFVDREWNPALNDQAEDRICRIGQTQGCIIHRLVGDHPIEERVDELLAIKQGVINRSVNAAATVIPEIAPVPEIDFAALAAAARAGEATMAAARAEAAQVAAQREAAYGTGAGAGGAQGGPGTGHGGGKPRRRCPRRLVDRGTPRAATTAQEIWAAQGLLKLAALDPDRARVRNEVGFNGPDTNGGHWLAGEIGCGRGLTDMQWVEAIKMCPKYLGQIGAKPEATAAA